MVVLKILWCGITFRPARFEYRSASLGVDIKVIEG
jgi:hypothetical protein